MKRLKKIIFCVLALTVMMTSGSLLTGCGSKEAENPLVGSWNLSEMQTGDKSYTLEEFAKAVRSDKAEEITILLDIDGEGDFVLHVGDAKEPVVEGHYSAADADGEETGEYVFAVDGGKQHVAASIEEDRLVLHDTVSAVETKMVFVKEQGGE